MKLFTCLKPIFLNTIEIATDARLSRHWLHSDLCVNEVGPAVHLQDYSIWKIDVHDLVRKESHGAVNKLPLVIEGDRRISTLRAPKVVQNQSIVTSDFPCIHDSNLDLMLLYDWATDDYLRHGRIVCLVILHRPVGCLEPALDFQSRALDDPEVTLTVEDQTRMIECENVRISPKAASLCHRTAARLVCTAPGLLAS